MYNVDIITQKYAPLGEPIPFKEWLIYPIRMNNYFEWMGCYNILDIDKNSLNDIDIIRMSYLQFLLMQVEQSRDFEVKLILLLHMCLGLEADTIISWEIKNNEAKLFVSDVLITKSGRKIPNQNTTRIITAQDFDEIKRIILYQNIIDYSDEYIDPDVKAAMDEYYALKNKEAEGITLEKQIAVIQSANGMTEETIKNMTVRGFQMLFNTIIDKVEYPINRLAEAQGVKFDKPIEHWAFKKPKDKFSEVFTSFDSFKNKISV
mgnify:CR=1 FL=1